MKGILVTGGCGFVGRNLTRRLLENSLQPLLIVDDLSLGQVPEAWLGLAWLTSNQKNGSIKSLRS